MKHRNNFSKKERIARSKAAKLVHDMPFVAGSLVKMARTCGKANCKCTKGDKHVSWYLAIRHNGARKMICLSRQREKDVIGWVNTYKEIMKQTDIISQQSLKRIMDDKKQEEE